MQSFTRTRGKENLCVGPHVSQPTIVTLKENPLRNPSDDEDYGVFFSSAVGEA